MFLALGLQTRRRNVTAFTFFNVGTFLLIEVQGVPRNMSVARSIQCRLQTLSLFVGGSAFELLPFELLII